MNLLCGEEPGSDAALHFNPRLDESTVVFNTLERGTWGAEERGSGIPFQRGQPFDVLLIATEEGFKVCLFHRTGSDTHVSSLGKAMKALGRGWEQRCGQGWAGPPLSLTSPGASSLLSEGRRVAVPRTREGEPSAQKVGFQPGGVDILDPILCPLATEVAALGQKNGWTGRQGKCRVWSLQILYHPGSLHFQSARRGRQ